MGATDHEIYKRRGRMNIQIGLVLGAFVLIVAIATMARLSSQARMNAEANTAEATAEATQ